MLWRGQRCVASLHCFICDFQSFVLMGVAGVVAFSYDVLPVNIVSAIRGAMRQVNFLHLLLLVSCNLYNTWIMQRMYVDVNIPTRVCTRVRVCSVNSYAWKIVTNL